MAATIFDRHLGNQLSYHLDSHVSVAARLCSDSTQLSSLLGWMVSAMGVTSAGASPVAQFASASRSYVTLGAVNADWSKF